MKHKKFLLIALICLIGIGISFLLFSAHRPSEKGKDGADQAPKETETGCRQSCRKSTTYDLLHRDAALALTIAPENTKAYYWLIRSYQKQHMDEMAAGELAAAKQKLPEDEYQKLLNSLER